MNNNLLALRQKSRTADFSNYLIGVLSCVVSEDTWKTAILSAEKCEEETKVWSGRPSLLEVKLTSAPPD